MRLTLGCPCVVGRSLVMVFLVASGLLALDRQVVQNFDDQDEGVPPTGWTVGTQGGQLGDWQVEAGELKVEGPGGGSGGGGKEGGSW